jgi:hypothetical protein
MNTGNSKEPEAQATGRKWVALGRTGAGHISVGTPGDHVTDGLMFVNGLHEDALANAALVASAPALQAAVEKALKVFADLSTEDFAKGGDKPARDVLEQALKESRTLPVLEKRKERGKK